MSRRSRLSSRPPVRAEPSRASSRESASRARLTPIRARDCSARLEFCSVGRSARRSSAWSQRRLYWSYASRRVTSLSPALRRSEPSPANPSMRPLSHAARVLVECRTDVAASGVVPQRGQGGVGARTLLAQRGKDVRGARVDEVAERQRPFLLHLLQGIDQRATHLFHDGSGAHQLQGVATGEVDGERPDRCQRDEWDQQQRHDLPADGSPAKAHGLPQLNPARRGWCSGNKRREPTTASQATRRDVRTIFGLLYGS